MTARAPARATSASRPQPLAPRRRASTSSSSRTATARRSGCSPSRARPTSDVEAYPLDVLGAETEGMIGYMIEQELGNLLPARAAARDHPDDGRGRSRRSGVRRPDQVHRAGLRPRTAEALAAEKGWDVKPDGDKWRRVVAVARAQADLRDPADPLAARARARSSSAPAAAASRRCTCRATERRSSASRRSSTRTARARCSPSELEADLFVMATDVDGGLPRLGDADSRRRSDRTTPCGARGDGRSRPGRWAPRSRPRSRSCAGPADEPRSAPWPSSRVSWPAIGARSSARTRTHPDEQRRGVRRRGGCTHGPRALARAVAPRHRHPGGPDLDHGPALRDGCDEWAAPGGAHDQRRPGRVARVVAGPPRRRHQRGRGGRRFLCDGGDLHPPRRGRPHRHVEHGRHDPNGRLLRPRDPPAVVLLPVHGGHLRSRRADDRQLVDDGRHPRRRVRRARPAAGRHRRRSRPGPWSRVPTSATR